jgi:dTDP-4-amino-4,6-dideoxygalactose transaminase
MDRFAAIAKRHKIALIEDCSHAQGATYDGKPVGTWSDVGCFSLQGEKSVSGGELGIAITNDGDLYNRMLILGHNGRTGRGQVGKPFPVDNYSLGLKYRPHLYGAVLAVGSLSRLGELNDLRRRNYTILSEELQGCDAVRPVETYPGAIRGGLLEYLFHYAPESAGGWNVSAFVKALRAEGVPVNLNRYTLQHQCPVFTEIDLASFGGFLGGRTESPSGPAVGRTALPITERLPDRLISMAPLTKVPEAFVRDCARGMRKVANYAARGERPANQ